jgi:hypothetical protein
MLEAPFYSGIKDFWACLWRLGRISPIEGGGVFNYAVIIREVRPTSMADNLPEDNLEDLPKECSGKSDAEKEICISHLVMDDLYKSGGSFDSALVPVDDSVLANQAAPTKKPELAVKGFLPIPPIGGYDNNQGLSVTIGSGARPFNSAGTENRVMNTLPTISAGGSVNFNYAF